ncbi:transporter substrate-binding domain-containing protein [Pseudodesulfovibrio methanolicus]|uniref:Transporter substrate-binding domain-containing protein n=1 Tax=Pseudodesulfovibrio methanolicus TaxID=3126690 RepID=A0ABZ2IZ31_9BACT
MRNHLNGFFFVLALLVGAAGGARAGEKPVLYWPYFNFPPYFITAPGAQPEGMGIDVARALQKEMPGYEHVFIHASPQRIAEELQTGREPFAVSGLLKTPEREGHILYADIPCRVTFTVMVVMRREDLWRLAPNGNASLAYLAADKGLTFGYVPGLSYDLARPFVARLISTAGGQRATTAHDVGHLLDMLAEKRIDWFVHDSLSIRYVLDARHMQERIAVVNAEECPPSPIFGYMACAWTEEGAAIMARINGAMARLVASNRLCETLRKWIPEQLDTVFERAYARRILTAAHLAADGGACCREETAHP